MTPGRIVAGLRQARHVIQFTGPAWVVEALDAAIDLVEAVTL